MERKGWYLIAYDIADPKRLMKVHALVRNEGVALQKSVFLVGMTEREVNNLLDRLAALISRREDELRAYPIGHPGNIWSNRVLSEISVFHSVSNRDGIHRFIR